MTKHLVKENVTITPVILQNQTGNNPNKWDKTGVVLENKPHSQVVIRVDGSRRVTTRNRRFVRKLNAVPITLTPKPSHSPAPTPHTVCQMTKLHKYPDLKIMIDLMQ